MKLTELRDCGRSADGGKSTLVEIVEIFSWNMSEVAFDIFRDRLALLDCDRSDAGEHGPGTVFQCGKIAKDEYFGVIRNAQVRPDPYAAGAIGRSAEFFAQRRCRDSGGPQDDRGGQITFAHTHGARLY